MLHTPLLVDEVPDNGTGVLFAHTVMSAPADTTGGCVKITETVSVTTLQVPLLVDVSVSNTVPDARSAAEGMYVPFSTVFDGLNVPVPLVVQFPVPVDEVPLNGAFGLLLQRKMVEPASMVGASVIVTIIESIAGRQVPFSVVVR